MLATGSVTLSQGTAAPTSTDAVSSIKVNDVEILGASVSFNLSLNQTAKDIAEKINQYHSDPDYSAMANGATIIITASPGSGSSANAYAVTATGTANLTATPVNMSGGVDAAADTKVQKVMLSVPFLAIVNVPALMVKNVDIIFDMEVKSSETHKDESSMEASLDASARVGWGPFSAEVKIHGAVSAHEENTRSTDRSAKYHIQVQARDDGMPEGLSRVLDMLQKAIAPVSVSKAVSLQEAKIGITQKAIL